MRPINKFDMCQNKFVLKAAPGYISVPLSVFLV